MEVAPKLILPWVVATVVLFIFTATHDWRALARWQRRYVIAASIVLPLFVYFVLLHWFEPVESYLYGLWLMVLIVLVCLIEGAGIIIGLMLLAKVSNAMLREIRSILRDNL